MLSLPIALAVGAVVPVQTAANARLRLSVGNRPIVPALISFTIALTLTVAATLVLQGNPLPQLGPATPWWCWFGGLFGALFVLGNILLFPKLGPVQTVVLPILGQVAMGLIIDQLGLFNSRQMDVGILRVLGALVVLAGILVVLGVGRPGTRTSANVDGPEAWIYRAIGVGIGMGSACQTAINGYMGTIVGSPLHASEINLFVGALLLLTAVLCTSPRQLATRPGPGPWWMWLGGVIGAIFVVSGAALAPILGTATTVIAFNAGTIAGGQVIESLGAFGSRRSRMNATRLVGLALVLVGVVAVRLL